MGDLLIKKYIDEGWISNLRRGISTQVRLIGESSLVYPPWTIKMKSFTAEPAGLVAIHTYLPSSATSTLLNSRDPNGVIVMSRSLVGSSITSSFFQVTSGSGSPRVSQLRNAASPFTTTMLLSPSELMVGGTE